jgi:UDP-N-acetylmuramyl pentapeptide synthase
MASHRIGHCVDAAEVAVLLRRLAQPGDVVLVKGSRVNKLERVVAKLLGTGPPGHPTTSVAAAT